MKKITAAATLLNALLFSQVAGEEKKPEIKLNEVQQELFDATGKYYVENDNWTLDQIEIIGSRINRPEINLVTEKEIVADDLSRNPEIFDNSYIPRPAGVWEFSTFTINNIQYPILINVSQSGIDPLAHFEFNTDPIGSVSKPGLGSVGELKTKDPGARISNLETDVKTYIGTLASGINFSGRWGNWFSQGYARRGNFNFVEGFPSKNDASVRVGWRDGKYESDILYITGNSSFKLDPNMGIIRGVDYIEQDSFSNLLTGTIGYKDELKSRLRWHVSEAHFGIDSGNIREGIDDKTVFVNLDQYTWGLELSTGIPYLHNFGIGFAGDFTNLETQIKDLEKASIGAVEDIISSELADSNVSKQNYQVYIFGDRVFRVGKTDFELGSKMTGFFQPRENQKNIGIKNQESAGSVDLRAKIIRQLANRTHLTLALGNYNVFRSIDPNINIYNLKPIGFSLRPDSSKQLYLLFNHAPNDLFNFSIEGILKDYTLNDGSEQDHIKYGGINLGAELNLDNLTLSNSVRIGKSSKNGFSTNNDERLVNIFRASLRLNEDTEIYGWGKFGSGKYTTPFYTFNLHDGNVDIDELPDWLQDQITNSVDDIPEVVTFPGRYKSLRGKPNVTGSLGVRLNISSRWDLQLAGIYTDESLGFGIIQGETVESRTFPFYGEFKLTYNFSKSLKR